MQAPQMPTLLSKKQTTISRYLTVHFSMPSIVFLVSSLILSC